MSEPGLASRLARAAFTPVVLVMGLAALAAAGATFGGQGLQLTVTELMIRVCVVVGISIFAGNSGVLSFGHIGFMCLGAYAAGWATCDPQWKGMMLTGLPEALRDHRWPVPAAILGGGALGAVAALVYGLAIMRLSGIAASIATFAFLVIVNTVYANWDSVTAGTSSLIGVPTVVGPGWSCLAAALSVVTAHLFRSSGAGLMLRASREDETSAAAVAIEARRLRLYAFVVSAFVVGCAGGVHAHFVGVLTTDSFYLDLTFVTVAMLIVGGLGSVSGAVAGTVLVTVATEILRAAEGGVSVGGTVLSLPRGAQEIGLGVLMILTLIFRPDGVMAGREVPFPRRFLGGRAKDSAAPRGLVGSAGE